MLNRVFKRTFLNHSRKIKHCFSTKTQATSAQIHLETKDEIDVKYEDEAFYLNKIFKQIDEEKHRMHQDYIGGGDLTEHNKREVEIVLDRLMRMSVIEAQYFLFRTKHHQLNTVSTNPYKVHIYYPKEVMKNFYNTPEQHMNPNYQNIQNLMSKMTPFIASGFFTGGAASPAAASQGAAGDKKETAKEAEKEVKKEKATFDIQLFSFDAAKKIVLIKEVRGLLNLGLKEAKEMVEKAPVVLKQSMKKEDIEPIKKKLEENGGVIKLI